MIANKHDVPLAQWRKWTALQRSVFNGAYSRLSLRGPGVTCHRDDANMPAPRFEVLAWNVAFEVAQDAPNMLAAVVNHKPHC